MNSSHISFPISHNQPPPPPSGLFTNTLSQKNVIPYKAKAAIAAAPAAKLMATFCTAPDEVTVATGDEVADEAAEEADEARDDTDDMEEAIDDEAIEEAIEEAMDVEDMLDAIVEAMDEAMLDADDEAMVDEAAEEEPDPAATRAQISVVTVCVSVSLVSK